MFSTLEPSAESSQASRCRVGLRRVSRSSGLVLALLLGVVFPQELPLTSIMCGMASGIDAAEAAGGEAPAQGGEGCYPETETPGVPNLLSLPWPKSKSPRFSPRYLLFPSSRPLATSAVCAPSPPPKPKEPLVVRTGLFGGAAEPVTTKRPVEQVQTGGFGSPQGFPGKAQGDSPGNVPKLGSFGLPEGPGVGKRDGRSVMAFREWSPAPVLAAG